MKIYQTTSDWVHKISKLNAWQPPAAVDMHSSVLWHRNACHTLSHRVHLSNQDVSNFINYILFLTHVISGKNLNIYFNIPCSLYTILNLWTWYTYILQHNHLNNNVCYIWNGGSTFVPYNHDSWTLPWSSTVPILYTKTAIATLNFPFLTILIYKSGDYKLRILYLTLICYGRITKNLLYEGKTNRILVSLCNNPLKTKLSADCF